MKQITKTQLEDIVEHISDNIGGYIYNSAAQNIAPTEATTTTSQEYKVGEQFYYNKILYTATVPIANGGTIVISGAGKNCDPSPTLTKQLADLGTASTKNSTSVVTESSDLVESGAVKSIVGWGNKNLTAWKWNTFTANNKLSITLNKGTYTISAQSTIPNGTTFIRGTKQDSSYCSKAELGVGDWTDSATAGVYATTELLSSYTFSVPEDNVLIEFGRTNCNGTIPAQLEKGSTATAYEPYHASVDESKADNSVIGTVEDGANPTKSYAVDEFIVRDGAFCQVTAPVTTSSTWTEGSNYTKKSIAEVLQSLIS